MRVAGEQDELTAWLIRARGDMTKVDLAKRIGTHPSYLTHAEDGKPISAAVIEAIADELGLPETEKLRGLAAAQERHMRSDEATYLDKRAREQARLDRILDALDEKVRAADRRHPRAVRRSAQGDGAD